MKYNLSVLPRADFDAFHSFVQACFDQNRRNKPRLATISNDWRDFPEHFHEKLKARQSLGTAMQAEGEGGKVFHLWMNPSWIADTQAFYNTLTHELVHGYVGLHYGHGQQWKHWFHRVSWHCNEAQAYPEYNADMRMKHFNIDLTYNNGSKSSYDSVVFAFGKAIREHDEVKKNFWSRIA